MYEHYYPLGIDAWWMDASEPNVRDCTDLQYRKDLCGPTALGPSAEFFNAYALMNADAIYNGQRGVDNNKRVFLLTRSGFAGLQRRYPLGRHEGANLRRAELCRERHSVLDDGHRRLLCGEPLCGWPEAMERDEDRERRL